MSLLPSLLRITLGLVLAYLILVAILYAFQDRLIFHPQSLPENDVSRLRALPDVEELSLDMADGTRLHGWFVKGKGPKPGVLLCFGGNGDEASQLVSEANKLPDRSWVLINYRGYGLSQGRPGEKVLFSDALEIYDRIKTRPDVDAENMVALGRSLGTGVAVHLAAHRNLKGVILVSPYESVEEIARESFPWLPVGLILRHPFHSSRLAPGIKIPALVVVAGEDQVVAPHRSRRLAELWGGETRVVTLAGADHNSLIQGKYWEVLGNFLAELGASPPNPQDL